MADNPPKSLEAFLPYEMSEIPEQLRCRARIELFEDEDTRIHSLKLLRSMLKDESNLTWLDEDLFLLAFLRTKKFDVKKAFHLVKTFYSKRDKYKELYYNFNFQDVKKTLESNCMGFLPYRDSDGSVILYLRCSHWDPVVDPVCDVMRALTAALMHAILYPPTQIAGFKVIFNFEGFSLRYVPHVQPTYVWLLAEGLQNCFPGRFKAILVINENPLVTMFWMLIKNFLTKKNQERIHFYGKNVKKIHKHISPSILPADLKGELPPFDNAEWRKLVEDRADYFYLSASLGYTKDKNKSQH